MGHQLLSRLYPETVPNEAYFDLTGVGWLTMSKLINTVLELLYQRLLEGREQLMMDEFANFKGHRYASVIVDVKVIKRSEFV